MVDPASLRVRFSPDIFRSEAHGGVSRYIRELHRGLLDAGADSRILAWLHRSDALRGQTEVIGLNVGSLRPHRARQALTKLTDGALDMLWTEGQGPETIYHKTYFDHRVPSGPTVAVTVYDMIHELFPGEVGSTDRTPAWKRPWCESADVVFAISETTRDDMLDRYGLDPDRVVVTYLGVTPVDPRGAAPPLTAPFMLYVGNRRRPYKGWRRLVECLPGLPDAPALLCFGGGPPAAEEDALLRQLDLADRVRFASGDDRLLAACYESAELLVYPSRYEGFGLPPLEAMAHGCPVVSGIGGSLREVLGDAAVLVDATDTDALGAAVDLALRDRELRANLSCRGRARAAELTWDKTVAATIEGYGRALDRAAGRRARSR